MRAATGLLAVLLTLSCTSFAQTATPPQTAPVQQAAPTQQPVPVQQAVAGGESKAEAVSQPSTALPSTPSTSPTASTPSTEAAAATADAVPAVPAVSIAPAFAPGMKIFLEPMNGFEERLAYSITKKKVPVVLVKERADADFVLSGDAHVHKRNFFTGMVLSTNGKGSISINDARTGNEVYAYKFRRVDANTTVDQDYQNWADSCAGHLKKALEPKK